MTFSENMIADINHTHKGVDSTDRAIKTKKRDSGSIFPTPEENDTNKSLQKKLKQMYQAKTTYTTAKSRKLGSKNDNTKLKEKKVGDTTTYLPI